MKPGLLLVLGSAIALAGCRSSSATSATPTTAPTVKAARTATSVGAAGATVAINTPHSTPPPVKGSAYEKGQTYLRLHYYAAAQQQFKLAIAQGQHVPEAYAGLGAADINLRQYKAAYLAFKAAAAREPKNAAFLYNTAYAALFANASKAAVAYASRFIQLQPRNSAGYHLRMLANGQLYRHHQQALDAKMIVQLEPRNPDAYNDLGVALTNDKQPAAAIAAFTQAIRMRPNDASYYRNRATAEIVDQRLKPALADLERARALTTDPATRQLLDAEIATIKKLIHR